MKKILRVFTRKTKATPEDENVRIATSPGFLDSADEIHISVSFTWDLPLAEKLEREWKQVAPVMVGGPATGQRSAEFEAGKYIKHGYTITSRGCPNRCWFCSVPKREGGIRELPIIAGNNILDDNLLACSDNHIQAVFDMLKKQKGRKRFTGGFEAAILKRWHVDELRKIKPAQIFFAYDTPDDYEPLRSAAILLNEFEICKSCRRCYVLIGYPKDSERSAEKRLISAFELGFLPMAMLWKDKNGKATKEWRVYQRRWARPAIFKKMVKLCTTSGNM